MFVGIIQGLFWKGISECVKVMLVWKCMSLRQTLLASFFLHCDGTTSSRSLVLADTRSSNQLKEIKGNNIVYMYAIRLQRIPERNLGC